MDKSIMQYCDNKKLNIKDIMTFIIHSEGNLAKVVEKIERYKGVKISKDGIRLFLSKLKFKDNKLNYKGRKFYGEVTVAEYNKTMQCIKEHNEQIKFTKQKIYSLSGLCVCQQCGSYYNIVNNGSDYIYYRCGNRSCKNRKHIRLDNLEFMVFEQLSKNYLDLSELMISELKISSEEVSFISDVLQDIDFWLELDNKTKWEINKMLIKTILLNKGELIDIHFKFK